METVTRSAFHPDVESYEQVNRDAMRLLTPPGRGYLALLGMSVALVGLLVFAELHNILYGLGMIGDNWAVMITTFVFWVGIGHAGTLISAILYLFRAPWRQAVYRFAEAMTVFAVLTAALFPLLHFVLDDLPTSTKSPELDDRHTQAILDAASEGKAQGTVMGVDRSLVGTYLAWLLAVGFLPAPSSGDAEPLPKLANIGAEMKAIGRGSAN